MHEPISQEVMGPSGKNGKARVTAKQSPDCSAVALKNVSGVCLPWDGRGCERKKIVHVFLSSYLWGSNVRSVPWVLSSPEVMTLDAIPGQVKYSVVTQGYATHLSLQKAQMPHRIAENTLLTTTDING